MKRYLLSLALLCLVATGAHAYWQSRAQVAIVTGGGGFAGPVDAIASPLGCWSLRACSAALRGNNAIQLCDDLGANCANVTTDATTGDLSPPGTHGANNCATSGTCKIKILYFQTGSFTCSAACDLSQATAGNMPTLSHTCNFSKTYCLDFAPNQSMSAPTNTGTQAQPFTISAVAKRTTFSSNSPGIFVQNGQNWELIFNSTTGQIGVYGGASVITSTQTESVWHAFQGVINGASSLVNVDGVDGTPGNSGTSSIINTASAAFSIGVDDFGNQLTGQMTEFVLYGSGFSSGNSSTMCANQRAYWGSTGSC